MKEGTLFLFIDNEWSVAILPLISEIEGKQDNLSLDRNKDKLTIKQRQIKGNCKSIHLGDEIGEKICFNFFALMQRIFKYHRQMHKDARTTLCTNYMEKDTQIDDQSESERQPRCSIMQSYSEICLVQYNCTLYLGCPPVFILWFTMVNSKDLIKSINNLLLFYGIAYGN